MANVFITVIAPLLGNILATIMLLSPTPAVLTVRRAHSIGSLNPLPYPLTALNCFGWVAYGLSLNNPWYLPPNFIGLIFGLYFSMQVLPYLERKSQDLVMGLLLGGCAYFCVLGVIGVHNMDEDQRQEMWGTQCLVVLLLYYAVPLTSMLQVIRAKDASSIYLPLAITAIVNGSMWTIYGLFGVHDFNLWMPNGIGVLMAIVQIVLRLVYGAKSSSSGKARTSGTGSQDGAPHDDNPEHSRRGSGMGIHLLSSFRRNHSWYWNGAASPTSPHPNALNGTQHPGGPAKGLPLVGQPGAVQLNGTGEAQRHGPPLLPDMPPGPPPPPVLLALPQKVSEDSPHLVVPALGESSGSEDKERVQLMYEV